MDFSRPLDISLPLSDSQDNPRAWYQDFPEIKAVSESGFVGKVSEGGSVNFNSIVFNPHAHGTHTECVGHITEEFYSVNSALTHFFFFSELISVPCRKAGDDFQLLKEDFQRVLDSRTPEALVVRTLPNEALKKSRNWSGTNWPYLSEEAAVFIREIGVKHLLIDLPSVDKEVDEGKLLAHKAFWNFPEKPRTDATITEMIFVPDSVPDGKYLLNLQLASFHNDASPSKPVLYQLGS